MKYIFTVIIVLFTIFTNAQIINIPDPVLKQQLTSGSSGVDTNFDGEIDVNEAAAVTSLYISTFTSINDFTGLESFPNLHQLIASIYNQPNIDFGNHLPQLKVLLMDFVNTTTSVDISGCASLDTIGFSQLNPSPSNPATLIVGNLHNIKFIGISDCHLSTLDVTGCENLKTIRSGGVGTKIHTLNINGLTHLDTLKNIAVTERLFAGNCTALKYIGETLPSIEWTNELFDVTGCINLETIDIGGINTAFLDLSTCTSLKTLNCSMYGVFNVRNINLKNGTQLQTLTFAPGGINDTIPLNICVDDFERDSVFNMAYRTLLYPVANYIKPLNVNSYCSFIPAGAYNTIQGEVKIDVNTNGCDNNDPRLQTLPIRITDTSGNMVVKYTNNNGEYYHYPYKGIYTITPYFPYQYFNITPNPAVVTFDTANSIINTADFCVTPSGVYNDLAISFLPAGPARPGFNTTYQLACKNRGTTTLSGTMQVNFDNAKMTFVSSTNPVNNQSAGQLEWNYSNILPFETRHFYVTFNLFAPPANNIGDTLIYLANVTPDNNDETPADNSFILPQGITGSYDPNDKQCAEGGKIDISALNKNLHYIIRFQNMGTDTAFNIVVADTLTGNVDWESFDFISSNHPCHITRNNNKLEFYFENINLPYKAINDAGSNGFVMFEVKPKNTLVVGDSINNTASIYFDFNPPVVTNKTTTIVSTLAPVAVKLEYFSLTGKEQSNLLTWKVATTDLSTTFNIERSNDDIHFTNIGDITATAQRCLLPFNFADDKPLNGKNYYRIKITDANGISFYSKILVTGKTRSGFELTAITGDQNNTTLYMSVSKDQTVQMKIIAADGRMVYSQSKTILAGTNQLNLQTGNFAKGIYTLIVYTSEGEIITRRFLR